MSIFSRIVNSFKSNSSTSGTDHPEEWLVDLLMGGLKTSSGVSVNSKNVIGIAVVFACVNIISKTIATLPIRLYQDDGKNKIIASKHPLHYLLSCSPNDEMTSVDFRRAMQANLSLHNNAYARVVYNGAGQAVEIQPIHPNNICPKRDEVTQKIYYELSGELTGRLDHDEVIHLKGLSFDGLSGVGLIDTVRDVLGLARALELNAAKFFANGSRPGSFLETDGTLSEGAQKRLKDAIASHKGVENSNKAMILEEGLKMKAARSTNRESQFDESRARQNLEICRIFGVQPHKVAILDEATYSNIEEQQIDWVVDVIMPIVITWEQSLNKVLLSQNDRANGLYFKMDLRGLLRGKMSERAEYYSKMVTMGAFSPNEVRRLEDMDPVEGLDYYSRPLNTEPITSNNNA